MGTVIALFAGLFIGDVIGLVLEWFIVVKNGHKMNR